MTESEIARSLRFAHRIGERQGDEAGHGGGRRSIVGIDGSPASFHALAFACGWAQRTGSELVIAHIDQRSWQQGIDGYPAAAAAQWAADITAALRAELASFMREQPCSWSFHVCAGPYPDQLERIAAAYNSDAIIVGRSRRRRLRRPTCARLSRISCRIIIAVP